VRLALSRDRLQRSLLNTTQLERATRCRGEHGTEDQAARSGAKKNRSGGRIESGNNETGCSRRPALCSRATLESGPGRSGRDLNQGLARARSAILGAETGSAVPNRNTTSDTGERAGALGQGPKSRIGTRALTTVSVLQYIIATYHEALVKSVLVNTSNIT
jgi:hypothetical protein